MRAAWRGLRPALLMLLAGCATKPHVSEATLRQLYARQRARPPEVSIFIPGIMGSVLQDQFTGRIVWGRMWSGALSGLALPIDAATGMVGQDRLRPTRLLDSFSWIGGLMEGDIYATTQRVALQVGGYTRGDLSDPKPGETGYAFKYDWRRDFVEAARQLGEAIDRIKQAQGRPDLKVRLLCHSAGGLIARYYFKYGTADVLDQDPLPPPTYAGAANISKIVMLGTPNAGSMESFQRLQEGLLMLLVGRLSSKTVFTMPASYQLLPFNGRAVFLDAAGRPLPVDLYEAENWERYGWSVFAPQQLAKRRRQWRHRDHRRGDALYEEEQEGRRRFLRTMLRRAERFHAALQAGDPAEERRRIQYVVMGADCEPTLNRALLIPHGANWRVRFTSWRRRLRRALFAYGDGSVTKDSLLGRCPASAQDTQPVYALPAHAMFFCENHFDLTKNVTYLDNVLHTLLEE